MKWYINKYLISYDKLHSYSIFIFLSHALEVIVFWTDDG